jgi:hypothetical protein
MPPQPLRTSCLESDCDVRKFLMQKNGFSREARGPSDCSVTITGHNTNAQKRSCHLGGDSVVHRAMYLRNDYVESDKPLTKSWKPFSTISTQSPSSLSVRDEFVASCESQMQLRISQPPAIIRDGLWVLLPEGPNYESQDGGDHADPKEDRVPPIRRFFRTYSPSVG